jgi:hypothetical protein
MYLLGLMEIAKDVLEAGLLDWTLMLSPKPCFGICFSFLVTFQYELTTRVPARAIVHNEFEAAHL